MPTPIRALVLASTFIALAGCGSATGERQGPGSAAPGAPVTEPASPIHSAGPATAGDPAPTPAEPARPAPGEPASLIGWWRGDEACIELFDNGDFELSLLRREPKVMVMGAATIAAAGEGFELRLATARIWKGRFTGPCRKVHETGDFIESQDVLGTPFTPGTTSTLKLRHTGDAQVELCGERCATLTRETPHLGARWRREKLTFPDRPEEPFSTGDLLELKLADDGAHLWAGLAGSKFGTVYGKTAVEYVAPDRFKVTFTAERFADIPEGTTPRALGLEFSAGDVRTLQVRRLAGERLEVCASTGRCATLGRQFDAYHHDLD